MAKYSKDDVINMQSEALVHFTSDSENWQQYCKSAAYLYKYRFEDTLLIAMQQPNATAVAPYETWKKLDAEVKKGSSGIPTLQNNSNRPVYVFDISQTTSTHSLWQADKSKVTAEKIKTAVEREIDKISNSQNERLKNFVSESAALVIGNRCGIDINTDTTAFDILNESNNIDYHNVGSAVNVISRTVLKSIERTALLEAMPRQEPQNKELSDMTIPEKTEHYISEGMTEEQAEQLSASTQTKQQTAKKEADPNIIGNTEYKYIPKKTYRKFDREVALNIAEQLDKQDIKYSGRINGDSITLTVSKDDIEKFGTIAEPVIKKARGILSDTEIENAKNTNIVDFMASLGMKTKRVGINEYTLPEHDSMRINGNKFVWNSRDIKGNALNFAVEYLGMDFKSAVQQLNDFNGYAPPKEKTVETKPVRTDPIPNGLSSDTKRTYAYLTKTRHLSHDTVNSLIKSGLVGQDTKGNAIFKIYDKNNELSGAEIVGTSGKRFKQVTDRTQNGFVFCSANEKPQSAILFEAAIDALSYYELHKDTKALLISMSGVKDTVALNMTDRYGISRKNTFTAVDNDTAGDKFARKMQEEYGIKRLSLTDDEIYKRYDRPVKDWNELLEIHTFKTVENFRKETEKSFKPVHGFTAAEIEQTVKEAVTGVLEENGIDIEITDVIVSGSRSRGIENADSDLDIVLEYKGNYPEDSLFNLLNDEETRLDIGGIAVDINPKSYNLGNTLETYLPTVEEYLREKAENYAQVEQNNKLTADSKEIFLADPNYKFSGTWSVVSESTENGRTVFELENDKYGYTSEMPHLLVDEDRKILGAKPIEAEKNNINAKTDNEIKTFPPLDDIAENRKCARYISENYGKYHSAKTWIFEVDDFLNDVTEKFGDERTTAVFASFVNDDDGRYSHMSKKYAPDYALNDREIYTAMHPILVNDAFENMIRRNLELDRAKQLINEFFKNEYGENTKNEFSDMTKVDIAYTTTEDDIHDIQVSVDLIHFKTNKYIDNTLIETKQFSDIKEMNDKFLSSLDFNDLVYVTEKQLAPFLGKEPVRYYVEQRDGDTENFYLRDTSVSDKKIYFSLGDDTYLPFPTKYEAQEYADRLNYVDSIETLKAEQNKTAGLTDEEVIQAIRDKKDILVTSNKNSSERVIIKNARKTDFYNERLTYGSNGYTHLGDTDKSSGLILYNYKNTDAEEILKDLKDKGYTVSGIEEPEINIDNVPETINFYRIGDFYEAYGTEAEKAAEILDLHTATKDGEPMVGIPQHIAEEYSQKLKLSGYSVNLSEETKLAAETKKSHLMFGLLGNGITVYDTSKTDILTNDYPNVAHISNEGTVEYYSNAVSDADKKLIQAHADDQRSEFMKEWNRYSVEKKYEILLSRCDTSQLLEITKTKDDLALSMEQTIDRFFDEIILQEQSKAKQEHTEQQEERENAPSIEIKDKTVTEQAENNSAQVEQDLSEAEKHISASDIKIGDRFSYNGREHTVTGDKGLYNDQVIITHTEDKGGFAYRVTQNIDTYELAEKGIYLGNINDTAKKENEVTEKKSKNFVITDNDLGVGGAKEKFQRNIAAIRLLKDLESENKQATPSQQEILSQYVGWGGIQEAFDPNNESWSKEYNELKEALTDSEYTSARASVLNSHYTTPEVIKAIYDKIEDMGFKGGCILEPSMGVGNFFGMLPENLRDNTTLLGVELDSITGRIAKQLYPDANISIEGFEETKIENNSIDIAVGNVPFGTYKIDGDDYKNELIHDYFFKKSLDKVKSGGIVAFITSKGTLDKRDNSVRLHLAERADLLGAVRLPNNAFLKNAGTGVTTDIIFLKKRDELRDFTKEGIPSWVNTSEVDESLYPEKALEGEKRIHINNYFREHPEMVSGKLEVGNAAYGYDIICRPDDQRPFSELLEKAMSNIKGEFSARSSEIKISEKETPQLPDNINAADYRNYCYCVIEDKIYFRENENLIPKDFSDSKTEKAKQLIHLSETLQELISAQRDNLSDESIKILQTQLNKQYDEFTGKYGILSARGNKNLLVGDDTLPLLLSLEILDDEGNFKEKADIFTKRTIFPYIPVEKVDTPAEALAVSISEKAKVDLDYMSELCGQTKEYITDDLKGIIFENPVTEKYENADEYLSGNVRKKLNEAKQAAENNEKFAVNVAALEQVMPQDLTKEDITAQLGSTWIPTKYYEQFMYELFETPPICHNTGEDYGNPFKATGYDADHTTIAIQYDEKTATFGISNKTSWNADPNNVKVNETYGTNRLNGYKIMEATLNMKPIVIRDPVPPENKKRVVNQKETLLAQEKQTVLKNKFNEWIYADPERTRDLCRIYNDKFNSIVPREYNGSNIKFGGINPNIALREHQKNAIARTLYGGNTLFAHSVGAGKTFEIVASAMEGKRLGLHNKSLICVPKAIVGQTAAEFMQLYPGAKILVPNEKDFSKENRQRFCSRIATGNYDAIIISHNQFEKIPLSKEREQEFYYSQLNEIADTLETIKIEKTQKGFTVKQLEAVKKDIERKLDRLINSDKRDRTVTFEDLGVDKLFIDEAHLYKNLFFTTKMGSDVAGINAQSESQRATDLFMKCRYLDELTGSRGTVLATGTPVFTPYPYLKTLYLSTFQCHRQVENIGLPVFFMLSDIK